MTSLQVRARAAAQVLVDELSAPVLVDADVHHLSRVLRLRDGEEVVACDGAGRWRRCAWRPDGRIEPLADVELEDPPAWRATVWLPALKGERAEWAVTKLTELGVDRIGLLACDHAAVRLDDADAVARVLARWGRVVREATCQSRRTRLPELDGPARASDAAVPGAARCDLDGTDEAPEGCTTLLVGPEGGWSDAERAASPGAVALSDTVLRSETAAVAAGVSLLSRRRSRHAAGAGAQ